MKNIFLLLFVSIGFLTSCVENPEEDPDTVAPIGDMQIDFDGEHFTSATTVAVLDAASLSIKGAKADGSYFRIAVPSSPVLGTYTWDEFGPDDAGFTLEFHPASGDPYVAARDDSGDFASFTDYTDTAQLVITNIDRVNKRISGTFKFTGVRFADPGHAGIATKVFTNGTFYSLPYTDTVVINPEEDNVLVKKVVNSYPGGGIDDQVSDYTYNGNKMLKEIYTDSDGFVETSTYTYNSDNLITQIETVDEDGLVDRETFTYEGDKLVGYLKLDFWQETGVKETYVHNAGETIDVTRMIGDIDLQETPDGTSTIYFAAGEVDHITFSSAETKTFTYDDKKNPFKNVVGFDKIAFVNGEPHGGTSRNLVSSVNTLPDFTFTYSYNDVTNYPTTQTIIVANVPQVVRTFTYQP